LIYFAICVISSVVGSVNGIGGGIIIKPLMDSVGSLGLPTINFLSGCTVLCMSGVSLLRNGDDIKINKTVCVRLAVGAVIGGIAGKELFYFIYELLNRQKLIGVIQTILLMALNTGILIYFFLRKRIIRHKIIRQPVVYIIIGFGLGLLSSFLGIGGGPLNIIILSYLFSMNPKEASLNSLFIIFCSQTASIASIVITGTVPVFEWRTLVLMCAGGVAGAVTGRFISKKISKNVVETMFIWVVIFLLVLNIFNLAVNFDLI